MKKKLYTRAVSVVLTDQMFDQIKTITDRFEIGISDYIRDAIQEKLARENGTNRKIDSDNRTSLGSVYPGERENKQKGEGGRFESRIAL